MIDEHPVRLLRKCSFAEYDQLSNYIRMNAYSRRRLLGHLPLGDLVYWVPESARPSYNHHN